MTNLDIIFQEWSASLGGSRPLTSDSTDANFEDLFYSLLKTGASFDEAYPYLNKAIKHHSPNRAVIKATYAKFKKFETEKEFEERWIKSISNKATSIFFSYFPRPQTEQERTASKPVTPAPSIGGFSPSEYRDYRAYADGFQAFTDEDLDKLRQERQVDAYNPLNDPKKINH